MLPNFEDMRTIVLEYFLQMRYPLNAELIAVSNKFDPKFDKFLLTFNLLLLLFVEFVIGDKVEFVMKGRDKFCSFFGRP